MRYKISSGVSNLMQPIYIRLVSFVIYFKKMFSMRLVVEKKAQSGFWD
jgi:hypothetical protein